MNGSEKLLREGATVYQLIHDRYKKGIEQFRNKFSFRVYADKEAGITDEEVARRLVACWNLLLPFTTEEIEAGIDLDKLVRENAALKTENERLRYLRDNFVRCEPKMDGKHHWIAKGRLIGSGNTFEEAIDTAMKERNDSPTQ